ncbi:NAD-dependent epimerase/dehydratase family protein [Calothrix sp. 336/3]|uniref:NAD-dependent epimerase/dehydratase family protein n=1 Tax=Calothrix sp. 336/3 TaxID=1337936 RepID=UPI0004E34076|nr:NAD(P)-dependent oxidoreductase [Calothrix sp. 336/3]AKG22774.1 epimerase [Calothrix sp. 336/3]
MKVLITGASGFLGKYVAATALQQGFAVRAMTRSTSIGYEHPNLEIFPGDLRQSDSLMGALAGVDAVIHLAASMKGDFATQYANTVTATENLLQGMVASGVVRLVGISSFSVFDYWRIPAGATITEDSPVEQEPSLRDSYAQTKLLQEKLMVDFQSKFGGKVTILRPGMIYGRENLWHSLLGVKLGDRLLVSIAGNAQMPLTYVENCADAIIAATTSQEAIAKTINIVDDNLPTRQEYIALLQKMTAKSPQNLSISWQVMQILADMVWFGNKFFTGGKVKLPSILAPAILHARFKPFAYSNALARQLLHWQPPYSLSTALERSLSSPSL